ncbi:DUF5821 family protein (plasmid) [Halococcus dombrowskii]|nr:DUF5821 family protein [Halococcus dombrowskii]UOO96613.1 DUF5821 family protein [Halococcus dombrowskii]
MSLEASQITASESELFQAILSDTADEVVAVNLDGEQLTVLVETIGGLSEPPAVRSLVKDSVARWLQDDFLVASAVADEMAAGNLSLRTAEVRFENTLLVTGETVVSVVPAGDRVAGLATDDEDFVATTREKWNSEWNDATEVSFRTPPRSEIHESLANEIGEEVDADFRAMLNSVETTRDKGALNEVGMSLLAAANNEIQLFEISKWGEDTGLASRATYSRTKTQLEDSGLLATEKVPMDVGRPRLRLLLGEELRGVDVDDLVEQAQKMMVAAPA